MSTKNSILFDLEPERSMIKVIGVGGGGCNAVNNMYRNGINGVEFIVCNTDKQALKDSPVQNQIQLGIRNTNGLGAGARPEKGKQSALESVEELANELGEHTRMVFITAGMGGGTGTGGAPVLAKMAREKGILTVGIVTTPFDFEGQKRKEIAEAGVAEMKDCVDSLLIIDNNALMNVVARKLAMKDAYMMADNILCCAAKGIAELITCSGYINVDFNDVVTVMKDSRTAIMGLATAKGEDRAQIALEEAFTSPLLVNTNIRGATGVLVNIETSEESSLTVDEMESIGNIIRERVGDEPMIIYGNAFTEGFGDHMSITLIVTGFPDVNAPDGGKRTLSPNQKLQRIAERKPQPNIKEELQTEPAAPMKRAAEPEPSEPAMVPAGRDERRFPFDRLALPNLNDPNLRRLTKEVRDLQNEEELMRYETEPAYKRFYVDLDQMVPKPNQQRSKSSINKDGRYVRGEDNGYLFNQVD